MGTLDKAIEGLNLCHAKAFSPLITGVNIISYVDAMYPLQYSIIITYQPFHLLYFLDES